jgi:hypothetical protein
MDLPRCSRRRQDAETAGQSARRSQDQARVRRWWRFSICGVGKDRAPLGVGRFAVPTEQGLGRDEERPPTCSREQPAERREDRPICRPVAKAPVQLTFQDADLVTEHHELDVRVTDRRDDRISPKCRQGPR